MGVAMMNEPKQSLAGKKKSSIRSASGTRQSTTEWPISDASSDLTVEVGSASFALHKFPLISRSGRIRRLLQSDSKDTSSSTTKPSRITLAAVPGGAPAFKIAAKFCYGVNTTEIITLSNIAMLRCVAEYLEMTDEYAEKNLVTRTETYLKETVLMDIPTSISVLHDCENLLPVAEDMGLVSRLITSIANNAGKQQLSSGLSKLEQNNVPEVKDDAENWWGKSLAGLRLDLFQRVVSALRLTGLRQDIICTILINYANTSLLSTDPQMIRGSCLGGNPAELQKKLKRGVIEAIVSLLPSTPSRKKSSSSPVPMAFLSSLLKSAIACSVSSSTMSDLERRFALRLDQAILEDILIPTTTTSTNNNNSTSSLYETDPILRIFSLFLKLVDEEDDYEYDYDEDDDDDNDQYWCYETRVMMNCDSSSSSWKQTSIVKVSKLLDSYLAEVALDSNMPPSKFISLAEILPDHARIVTDGLYKAVDVFLKVHPNMKDPDRHRLCKTIDCQKLSQEACSHAAQNERLPVQMAVQVLYFEQTRLRQAMNNNDTTSNSQFHIFGSLNGGGQRCGSGVGSGAVSPRDNYASVRRENRELKLEVARMRMRLTDLEKDHVSMKQELVGGSGGGGGGLNDFPGNKLFRSLTRKLGKLGKLFFSGSRTTTAAAAAAMSSTSMKQQRDACSESRFFFRRQRHHSIS